MKTYVMLRMIMCQFLGQSIDHVCRALKTTTYFIADWEHWLGDWEHLEPMMQQLYSFLLFCCCDDKSIRATFKPSYVSKYMPAWIEVLLAAEYKPLGYY